jgi:uracil-DNA glycosylase
MNHHNIHISWNPLFSKYNFDLDKIYNQTDIVYPPRENIFKVFEMGVKDIRVLLLGQDPYHNPNQANGLSFSVNDDIVIPPSLRNIYKEIQQTFPERNYTFKTGNLERWFKEEKIFLLNASLSVIHNKPASHMAIWTDFTNDVIKYISEQNNTCIFVLLGNFAKSKAQFISNSNKNNIIVGVHPSPLSASRGFFGSNIFKTIEDKLGAEICWLN